MTHILLILAAVTPVDKELANYVEGDLQGLQIISEFPLNDCFPGLKRSLRPVTLIFKKIIQVFLEDIHD